MSYFLDTYHHSFEEIAAHYALPQMGSVSISREIDAEEATARAAQKLPLYVVVDCGYGAPWDFYYRSTRNPGEWAGGRGGTGSFADFLEQGKWRGLVRFFC